jgi:hypothetical protein
MYSIDGRLTGLAPFLCNRMVDSSVLDTGISGTPGTKDGRLEEAEKKVYVGADGNLCIPRLTLKRVILDGARESKVKVLKVSLSKLVAGAVFVDSDPSFGVKTRDFIHEAVGKIPPRTGKAAIIRRPALDTGWTLDFRLNVLDEFAAIPSEQLKAAVVLAGIRIGMGSWRPEFGRFMVSKWETAADAEPKTKKRAGPA